MTISGIEQPPRVLRVLHVEDSELDHQLICAQLARGGLAVDVQRLDALPAVLAALARPWDAIISDFNLPGYSGLQVLDALKERQLLLPFILVSGEIGEDIAVAAMRDGASDYLLKNNLNRLAPACGGSGADQVQAAPAPARRPPAVQRRAGARGDRARDS